VLHASENVGWPLSPGTGARDICTTDTVPIPGDKRLPNMTVLSIAPLLAEAIHRIRVGKSVSRLFDATA
jgi:ribose-phosphate pyrophosphokinase